jgi:hypothetical protein
MTIAGQPGETDYESDAAEVILQIADIEPGRMRMEASESP